MAMASLDVRAGIPRNTMDAKSWSVPTALPFPTAAGYTALAMNGMKGGGTKYVLLQFLNYARWTAQRESCGMFPALRLMVQRSMVGADGRWRPLGFFSMWHPGVTLINETLHWGMKVPLALAFYDRLSDPLGKHVGLFAAVALSTAGEVAVTGWSERFGVHLGLNRQITSYKESYTATRTVRSTSLHAAYNGSAGLWVRNFSWNFAFFEWKRYFHALVKEPEAAPFWLRSHIDWLRTLETKNQANILTFESATLATYLTFVNMAGDNVKTKMSADPESFPTVRYTVSHIYREHGLLGFTRGSMFKGIYLIAGATVAIGVQERLTEVMAKLYG